MSHVYDRWQDALLAFVCERCGKLLTAEELEAAKNLPSGRVIQTPCKGNDD